MNEEIANYIRTQILLRTDPGHDIGDDELSALINRILIEIKSKYIINVIDRMNIAAFLMNDIKKLGILQELLEDDTITEVMVNGYNNIFYERSGHILKWDKQFESKEKLCDIVQRIAAKSNKIINESVPIADTRLGDGSRVNIVLNPVAIDGPVVTIRKFYNTPLSMDRMIELNSITREAADFLKELVENKYNIFISGGTGSGKTTFLNALSNYIPSDERIITIEDSAELQLSGTDNLVRLEARNANIEGNNEISIRELIKASLRMRPDRIIVGEVRGGETIDMLQAMNTGHDGSLSTGHANSTEDMLSRLETMVLQGAAGLPLEAIRQQIASAVDIIIHLSRLRDKSRKTMEITEVVGYENGQIILNPLYKFEEDENSTLDKVSGKLNRTANPMKNDFKLRLAGIKTEI